MRSPAATAPTSITSMASGRSLPGEHRCRHAQWSSLNPCEHPSAHRCRLDAGLSDGCLFMQRQIRGHSEPSGDTGVLGRATSTSLPAYDPRIYACSCLLASITDGFRTATVLQHQVSAHHHSAPESCSSSLQLPRRIGNKPPDDFGIRSNVVVSAACHLWLLASSCLWI